MREPNFSSCGIVDVDNKEKENLKFCTGESCTCRILENVEEVDAVEERVEAAVT